MKPGTFLFRIWEKEYEVDIAYIFERAGTVSLADYWIPVGGRKFYKFVLKTIVLQKFLPGFFSTKASYFSL